MVTWLHWAGLSLLGTTHWALVSRASAGPESPNAAAFLQEMQQVAAGAPGPTWSVKARPAEEGGAVDQRVLYMG